MLKHFRLSERFGLEFRSEFYNSFNRANFGPPTSNIENIAAVGRISNAGEPRDIQFGLKLAF